MSTEAICKVNLSNKDLLIQSLEELYGKNNIKVADRIKVSGYMSSKNVEIEVKINGLYGTAGFFKNKDNNYEFVYDSTDKYKLKDIVGEKEENKLMQTYSNFKVKNVLQKLRRKVTSEVKEKDGKIRLKVQI